MISLDQVFNLEQKVESAVAKIEQMSDEIARLSAENDALRSKCAELTNALSAKTEQLSAFQTDQSKIELGIIKALEQLRNITESSAGASPAPETRPAADEEKPADEPQDESEQESESLPAEESTEEPFSDGIAEDDEETDDETDSPSEWENESQQGEENAETEDAFPTEDDRNLVLSLAQKGRTVEEIADFLGRTVGEIASITNPPSQDSGRPQFDIF